MNNKKSTKRALLTSVLSLVLCMSMLIGTTFAWFTDSVSSTNNIIKSGNLDVELEYYDGDSWEKVTATTNVFEENTLWEPGHTEVVYLKVSNLGTLALKYQLGINIVNEVESINVAGEALRLSDYIEFGAIEDVSTPYADRAAARAAVTDSVALSTGYTKAGSIEAGADEQYVALVVYMPETVGNEANYRTGEVAPQIDLGINLMATQYTSEFDSFNNQYDDVTIVDNLNSLKAAIAEGGNILLNSDIAFDADETITVSASKNVVLDLNGKTISSVSNQTGSNRNAFDVRGTLTVRNGAITTKHVGANMGWGSSTNVFNVTAGGILNIEDAIVKNLGGSDMAFVAHLNNWGEVTLNVDNSVLTSTYTAVRVFNSGNDMNNVNITNSTLMGASQSFWVHNFTVADFGNDTTKTEAAAARLNFNFIVDNPVDGVAADDASNLVAVANNTFVGKIRYGFTDGAVYYNSGEQRVAANADSLVEALENGSDVTLVTDVKIEPASMSNAYGATGINVKNGQTIDGQGNTLDIKGAGGTWDSGISTTGGLIKNITITGSFRGIFINHNSTYSEPVVLENVIIDGTTYTISCDQGKNQNLEAYNSTFNGWTSYAATIGTVSFTDCSFGEGNGYAFCRPYATTSFVGCDFAEGYLMDPRADVIFEDCTINGVPLTTENLSTLVYQNIDKATVR